MLGRRPFRRGAHSRGGAEDRLRSLGSQVQKPPRLALGGPSLPWQSFGHRRWGRPLFVVVVLVVVVLAAVQWFRGVPAPTFHAASTASLGLPGAPPTLPWPTSGAASLSEVGVGSLGQSGATGAVPIASLAKVMTAYVVLRDHPLANGQQGPAIAVTPAVVSEAQAGLATDQSELKVATGESLTELQALEGLLLIGANDMATLLAGWDAGSTASFVSKMNDAAKALGLSTMHITDPSGLDPGTVAGAADMVQLGQKAMADPVLAQIVRMPQATEPVAGVVYNLDNALGHDGIVGIKTGSSTQAGGCFLFEATQSVAGQPVTLLGVVLGNAGSPPISSAITRAEDLLQAAFGAMQAVPVVAPGTHVGTLTTAWGATSDIVAGNAPSIVSAPGLVLHGQIRLSSLSSSLAAGARVGNLVILSPGRTVEVPLVTARALSGPGIWWRLSRT